MKSLTKLLLNDKYVTELFALSLFDNSNQQKKGIHLLTDAGDRAMLLGFVVRIDHNVRSRCF